MKQLLQDLKKGDTYLEEIPTPQPVKGQVLIRNSCSLVSVGTEKMLISFGKANLLDKARQQPDKVRQVLDKVKTDGLLQTVDAVRSKLNQPLPLGYSASGTVINGGGTSFKEGDRVVSNGHHAEVVRCAQNLVAKIPDNVTDEEAAFTVVGAIALQGVRLVNPTIGETVVVTGLGLVGLLCGQILRANGCRVLGFDFAADKVAIAQSLGIEAVLIQEQTDPVKEAMHYTDSMGVDAVIIAASTQSNDPVSQAAKMCRKRGRIVLVGVTGLNLSRADFFEKELTFQVSCSYGPGRYDPNYESKGLDYPLGFVRWTEQRNFEAFLQLMSLGHIDVKPLITHQFDFENAINAYQQVETGNVLGVLLKYPDSAIAASNSIVSLPSPVHDGNDNNVKVTVLGAGNYAGRVLIPAFKDCGANLNNIVSSGGLTATTRGKEHGFSQASTSEEEAFKDDSQAIVLATQHNLHARQTIAALQNRKHVFIEKPLALTLDEVSEVEAVLLSLGENRPVLTVGFNRRFSPQVMKMKSLLDSSNAPKAISIMVNAGAIPKDHWTQDPEIGGGRIVGEVCHFVDLARHLAASPIKNYAIHSLSQTDVAINDNVSINLQFDDGSMASIQYLSNGHASYPKETVEVFVDGKALRLNNFRKLEGFGWKGFKKMNLWRQDKGQRNCVAAFLSSIKEGNAEPIPLDELLEVSRCVIDLSKAVTNNND